ncbi:MAG: tRNA cytidylyltransferase [Gemmatimonadetes bacterium]|nr:tRNA cytidylyltransferase [Gemmatimonadota bacterium]
MTAPHAAALRPPDAVTDLARRLRDAGFEAWCVGGAVRDALLGVETLDWDLATSATPDVVRKLFRRTVPVGIEFGTVGVFDREGHMHEVTTFRRDVQTDGRHAVVEFGASLDDDLARRDFTINAIAWDPVDRQLRDPFGGQADLAARTLRAVGVARERMLEDRLRALRALRFASRFDFTIAHSTWEAIVESAPHLTRLSPERVKQEIEKTLEQVRCPSRAFRLWRDAGAFATLVPALAGVSDAVLAAVDQVPRPQGPGGRGRTVLRLALLCSAAPAASAESMLRALRFSNQQIAAVTAFVDRWHRHGDALGATLAAGAMPDDRALRRTAASVGRLRVGGFMRVCAARWATAPDSRVAPSQVRALHRRLLDLAFHAPLDVGDLAVDGDDLRAAGVPPGPRLGQLLQVLLDAVLDEPALNERAQLLAHPSVREACA